MKKRIENPKVFISYAWGTDEYQNKVLAFATDLVGDGIDVVIDRWSLKEGNDTYAFMEQSVTDSTISNVLILLDPIYEKKANDRNGGVGTETQIISPEIYNKIKQEKFLPVVFERREDGYVPKPQYLKGLLHFDLSQEENYDLEYRRLVKRLYGIEILSKPKLGDKPSWLEESIVVSTKKHITYESLKKQQNDHIKQNEFRNYLSAIKDRMVQFADSKTDNNLSAEEYIEKYASTREIRDDFLLLLKYSIYVHEPQKIIASTLEEICVEIKNKHGNTGEIVKSLLHEIFIYVIAFFLKNKEYEAINYLLTKTYFVGRYSVDEACSFEVFYYNNYNLDNAVSEKDGNNYYSGTANYWVNNINTDICNKNEFVFADEYCYNAAIMIENYCTDWLWFPITYAYGKHGYGNSMFHRFAIRLKSMEYLKEVATSMGYSNVEAFKEKFKEIEEKVKQGIFKDYRYRGSYETAPLIWYYIKSEELGIRN